jgi:predicted transcriptional regulator
MPSEKPPTARTPLSKFLERNNLTSAQLEIASGISRQSMTRIRAGHRDVRLSTIIRIVRAARRLTRRQVQAHELFDLDPDSPRNLLT